MTLCQRENRVVRTSKEQAHICGEPPFVGNYAGTRSPLAGGILFLLSVSAITCAARLPVVLVAFYSRLFGAILWSGALETALGILHGPRLVSIVTHSRSGQRMMPGGLGDYGWGRYWPKQRALRRWTRIGYRASPEYRQRSAMYHLGIYRTRRLPRVFATTLFPS